MPHGDAVIDRDGVELDAPAACGVDHFLHALPDIVQMHVAWDELRKAVGDGDDRLVEVRVLHPGCAPKGARAGHVAALSRGAAAVSHQAREPSSLVNGCPPERLFSSIERRAGRGLAFERALLAGNWQG